MAGTDVASGRRRVTAQDVARRAGVSQSTVSYVLNDNPNQTISEATRLRVLAAADELRYTPSAVARALRRGSSQTVLMVLPDVPIGATVAQLIEMVSDAMEPHGYSVVYRRQRAGQRIDKLWKELMPAAVANLSAFSAEEEELIEQAGIPVVRTPLDRREPGVLSVPQVAVGRIQAEHLLARGHRRLGYAAPVDDRVTVFYAPRLAGVREACDRAELPPPQVLAVPLDAAAAAAAVDTWRRGADRVTAVCAYNDEVAFAVLAGLRLRGLRAPGDLAVIGVDNVPLAPFADPPLSTVDIHTEQTARGLADLLLARLVPEEPGSAAPVVATELVPREST